MHLCKFLAITVCRGTDSWTKSSVLIFKLIDLSLESFNCFGDDNSKHGKICVSVETVDVLNYN